MAKNKLKKVSIVMGSQSDYKTMIFCQNILKKLNIKFETKIISAHRTLRGCMNLLLMLKKMVLQ